jgi:hypothetical protein
MDGTKMTPKFQLDDSVIVHGSRATVVGVHVYRDCVEYSVEKERETSDSVTTPFEVPECDVSYTETETLRREVSRLTAEVARLKQRLVLGGAVHAAAPHVPSESKTITLGGKA